MCTLKTESEAGYQTKSKNLITQTGTACANKIVPDQLASREQSDQGLFVCFLQ